MPELSHRHQPVGAYAIGVGCVHCDAYVVDLQGPYEDATVVWSDGRETGRAL